MRVIDDPAQAASQAGRIPSPQALAFVFMAIVLVKGAQFGISLLGLSSSHAGAFEPNKYAGNAPLFAWDSLQYRDILVIGYPEGDHGIPPEISFFPLYPLAAKCLPFMHPAAALLLVANVASAIGLLYLFTWAYTIAGDHVARWTLVLTLAYPPAMFLSAAYTEGPFLLLVGLTFHHLQKERLLPAALASGLACATRPTGLALSALVLTWALTRAPGVWRLPRVLSTFGIGLISVSGLICYEGYLTSRYGQWDAYFVAQHRWEEGGKTKAQAPDLQGSPAGDVTGRASTSHRMISKILSAGAWSKLLGWSMFFLTLAGFLQTKGDLRVYLLFPLIVFLLGYLPGWGLRITSIARFETSAAPVFLLLGTWAVRFHKPLVWWAGVGAASLLQSWYIWEFTLGKWCG